MSGYKRCEICGEMRQASRVRLVRLVGSKEFRDVCDFCRAKFQEYERMGGES